MISVGFVVLFVVAFPLAPLLAFFSQYLEYRVDGYKMLFFYRRVFPRGAEDIGMWETVLKFTSYVAVASNSGLIFFTLPLGTVGLYSDYSSPEVSVCVAEGGGEARHYSPRLPFPVYSGSGCSSRTSTSASW